MSGGPTATAGPNFVSFDDDGSDDLPRTLRREKEARAREARERAAQERAAAPSLSTEPAPQVYAAGDTQPYVADMPFPAVVRRFDVPFLHLTGFFLKAVIAAIPALLLLTIILWFAGALLQATFPELVKMRILISFPNG